MILAGSGINQSKVRSSSSTRTRFEIRALAQVWIRVKPELAGALGGGSGALGSGSGWIEWNWDQLSGLGLD